MSPSSGARCKRLKQLASHLLFCVPSYRLKPQTLKTSRYSLKVDCLIFFFHFNQFSRIPQSRKKRNSLNTVSWIGSGAMMIKALPHHTHPPTFNPPFISTVFFVHLPIQMFIFLISKKSTPDRSVSFASKYKVKQVLMALRVLHTQAVFLHCSQWKRSMPMSQSRPNRSQVSASI